MSLLPRRTAAELALRRAGLDPLVRETAAAIMRDVWIGGEAGLRYHAERLGDLAPEDPLVISRLELTRALERLTRQDRRRLERVADRIRTFAEGQRAALAEFSTTLPGGRAGHSIAAVERAGCYAPGGRYPLPSSVLMTALTARAAGVAEVWVASPRPALMTLAAAALAGADGLLAAGGAQAIAALAHGAGTVPACDAVVGPGNAYVTAAKQLIAGQLATDGLAGPSELLVLADDTADPALVAADLLAQAEHDPDAVPILVAVGSPVGKQVETELAAQLESLPTASIARAALANGGTIVVGDVADGINACDRLAPEHVAVHTAAAREVGARLRHYGALFIGSCAAEVLGDYGAGPNHVLPTGGGARARGGLSVFTFLRIRTWLEIDDSERARDLIQDAVWLGRLEGLEAHARSAELRLRPPALAVDFAKPTHRSLA